MRDAREGHAGTSKFTHPAGGQPDSHVRAHIHRPASFFMQCKTHRDICGDFFILHRNGSFGALGAFTVAGYGVRASELE